MATIVDQAVVVRVWDWSETSQTVSLFTREHGMLRGVAKGAKREKGRFSGGLETLTRGEVVAIVKPNNSLATLTDWDLQELFPATRRDLRVHYASLYFVDLVQHFLTDADPHPILWDALLESLRALREGVSPAFTLLKFQWRMLLEAGYRPDLSEPPPDAQVRAPIPGAYGFDPSTGRLTHDPGGQRNDADANGPWRVRGRTMRLLRNIDSDSPESGGSATDLASTPPEDIDRANRLLAAYARWVLGREPPTMSPCLAQDSARTEPRRRVK